MTPTLYIIMRNDMVSMNPGKGMAQAAHAANAFEAEDRAQYAEPIVTAWDQWRDSTSQKFGTTIVLQGNVDEMYSAVELAIRSGLPADVILDPTYPVQDGAVTHLIPVYTCAYVFTHDRAHAGVYGLSGLGLHP